MVQGKLSVRGFKKRGPVTGTAVYLLWLQLPEQRFRLLCHRPNHPQLHQMLSGQRQGRLPWRCRFGRSLDEMAVSYQ